jgi:hypothetical protein
MTMADFWGSVSNAVEFGFRRSSVPTPAYPYPDELVEWMRNRAPERGHAANLRLGR